jgi:uncharacterized tellurite resistance protein B-like protein
MAKLDDVRTAVLALVYDALSFERSGTTERVAQAVVHIAGHPLFAGASARSMKPVTEKARALVKEKQRGGTVADLAARVPLKHKEAALKLVAMALAADGRVTASEDAYWRRLGAALGFSRGHALEVFHNGVLTHHRLVGPVTEDPGPPVSDDARRAILTIVYVTVNIDGELGEDEQRGMIEGVMFHPLFLHLSVKELFELYAQALEEMKALPPNAGMGALAARVPAEQRAAAYELAFRAVYADGAFDRGPETDFMIALAEALALPAEEVNAIYRRVKAESEERRGAVREG